MKTYPLKSLNIEQAQNKQFQLIEAIANYFSGDEILTRGDLGVVKQINQPKTTKTVEKVLSRFFNSEDALLVRGAGTNAIRLALHSFLKAGNKLLVHEAPIYPTTEVSLNMLGIEPEYVDFNCISKVIKKLKETSLDGILIQVTRQKIDDSYDLQQLIYSIREENGKIPIITDDNYSALKTEGIGVESGATLSCFSTFKLLGPEGIGCIVGDANAIKQLRKENYSGGGQVQGHEAIDVLRGMIYAPVSLAIAADVGNELCQRLNDGEIAGVKKAFVVNAQSRVVIVELKEENAKTVIEEATKLGALPNPVGAESKYEFLPLVYRVSGTFRKADPAAENYMLRINPNRAGADTIIKILQEAILKSKK